jgi:hypothetical protein
VPVFITADSLARSSARAIIQRIQDLLVLDIDGSYNPGKPWYAAHSTRSQAS